MPTKNSIDLREIEPTSAMVDCLERCSMTFHAVMCARKADKGQRHHLAYAIQCALERGVAQDAVADTINRALDDALVTAATNVDLLREGL